MTGASNESAWRPLLPTSPVKVGDRVRIEYEAGGVTWRLIAEVATVQDDGNFTVSGYPRT